MYTNNSFNYEIIEHIATLSINGTVTKELNKISFNGNPPKYDLRSWKRDGEGEQLLKGITLTEDEIEILLDSLNEKRR
jgi:hypothetical protein